jgi:DNA-binding response OmpR family regulator
MTRILVVEDERDLARGIKANLELEGYEVHVAATGEEALAQLASVSPDLVILDLMLPGLGGFEVLERMREDGSEVLVLILSARSEEVDKVRGFRTGADDFLTKPFGVLELIVRLEALLRRRKGGVETSAAPPVLQVGASLIDADRRALIRDGVEIPLTPKEFELLMALHRKRDRIVSRQELLRDVWGYSADVTTRTVDVHIAELRRKLEVRPRHPEYILTVWRGGYRLRC